MAAIALAFLIPSALLASLIANGVSAGYAGGAALPSGIRTGSSEPGRSSGPLAAGDNEWRNALPPPPTLEARWAHAMAYDLESDRVLLFGGATLSGPMSDQTWAYNPATNQWADMSPSRRPSLREGMGLAYDAESDRVVLFGGGNHYTNVYNDETWSYDYNTNTWTNMNPAVRPSARADMQIAYDGQSDRMVLFGGATTVTNNETWSYDYNTNTWTNMNPSTRPSPRQAYGMAYDARSDRVVLFGGAPGPLRDTWTYDYDTNSWSNTNATAPPPARWGTRMTYDLHANRTILFGGWSGAYQNDTWAYDSGTNAWTNLNPTGTPGALESPGLTFAACSNRVVLFGGYRGPSAPVILSNETWSYTYAAVAPTLQRQPASIDFGTVVQGWSGTSIAQIRNGGSGTLCYSAAASAPWLTVAPSKGTSVGEWDTLIVSVDTAGLAQGPHSANIAVSSNAGSASVSVALIVNRDPVLAATGEANYVSDGLDPEVGNLSTTFSYRVSYADADNDPPAAGNPKVDIRKGGVPISGSPVSMTEVDTADVNFIDGKGYRLDTALPARGTDYEYQFQAEDAFGNPAADWPAAAINSPDVLNRGPFLSWVGVAPYASDGLDVEAADLSGTFVFRVTYTDADNDQPQPGVSLTLLKGVIPVAGSPFLMAAEDPSDVTYSDGKVYTLALGLRVRGNDYVYSFRASDGMDAAAGGPTVFTDAPDVENRLPRLTFLGGGFSNGVQPDSGPRGSAFTFEIVYHDDDNDGPAVVELLVEKAGTPYGLPLEMNGGNWIGSSGDFVAGRVYSIVVALLDEGSDYTFRFRASDAYEPSRTVDTSPLNGPDVGPGPGTIVVTVIADGAPLGGAQVSLFVGGQAVGPPTRTDATGEVTFPGLAPGEYTLRAAGEGYLGASTTVSLAGGERLYVTIALATPVPESNWKPLLAGVFAAILEVVALVASRIPGGSKAARKSIVLTSLPFVGAEVSSGLASYLTGYLSVPPVIGLGSLVDSAILGAGLIVILLRTRPKGDAKDQAAG